MSFGLTLVACDTDDSDEEDDDDDDVAEGCFREKV